MKRYLPLILIAICIVTNFVEAQTTEFTYQGKLNEGSTAATGDYNFEFRLFSVNTGGTVISTIQRLGVPVSSGVFTVKLDFGANFDGQPRWLEIAIKPAGDPGGFQQLLPRQPVTSAPYSVRSLNASTADTATNATNATTATNATQLGGVAANQYVLTGDPRLSDARNPLPGNASYIQNRTSQQSLTNFNISGDGTAGGTLKGDVVNAVTQYNIGGNGVLSTAGTNNVFVGHGTGTNNNTGTGNSFLGQDAGTVNAAGSFNTFVGRWAGFSNTGADSNTFVGFGAGKATTTAGGNAFFGANAGNANTTGSNNTIIGANADFFGGGNFTFATAIGAGAVVSLSNEITLGRANGSDSVDIPGQVLIGGQVTASGGIVIFSGTLQLGTLGAAGNTAICLNASDRVGTCSSSLRYKTNLAPYRSGLNILNRLRPITFDWKDGGMHDLGLGAEDVEKIDPLLVTYNKQGQVEGVKYDRIGVVLVNAVKEQQAEIERQKQQIQRQDEKIVEQGRQIGEQQRQLEDLKKLVCLSNPQADVCK